MDPKRDSKGYMVERWRTEVLEKCEHMLTPKDKNCVSQSITVTFQTLIDCRVSKT